MFKTGVQCLRCQKIFCDKSGFNKHQVKIHQSEDPLYETGVAYAESNGVRTTDFDWSIDPLPVASSTALCVTPGLLERETKILSKAAALFSDTKWSLGEPSVGRVDEATAHIDLIDDLAWNASTLLRSQIMRSKSGAIKVVPFQPLKDTSGGQYAKTLSRFKLFAERFFERSATIQELILLALQEKCNSQHVCCLESFIYWLVQHVPNFKNADPLQHAAMHMRRVLRGTAMMHMHENVDEAIEPFCMQWLNPTKAAAFGVLTTMYYEIKRCVPHDKRLLIQRTDPDDGFPTGSAVSVDTGRELVRVSWNMMRSIISTTVTNIQAALDEIQLPGQAIDLATVKDFEDSAIGAGIMGHNAAMFSDADQIEWLKNHSRNFTQGRKIFDVLQKASRDFLAGIGANIGGGSRRIPELCCITLEVTAQNPTRCFRIFENEGVFVGDYRKQQGAVANPSEDLTLWVIPAPLARIMCRLIIFGKPIEVRLAQKLLSDANATDVHRTLFGAFEGKPLKSTKLGELTNSVLSSHGCPHIHYMRHAREHFSTELALQIADSSKIHANQIASHLFGIAATASNHSVATSKSDYAGVFEKNSVGGLRQVEAREKMAYSRTYNHVVLGFAPEEKLQHTSSSLLVEQKAPQPSSQVSWPSPKAVHSSAFSPVSQQTQDSSSFISRAISPASQPAQDSSSPATPLTQPESYSSFSRLSQYGAAMQPLESHFGPNILNERPHEEVNEGRKRSRDSKFQFLVQRFKITEVRELQRTALHLLLDSCAIDTKIIQAPTSTGKDMLPFAMAVLTGKVQLIFVPFVALIENVIQEGAKFKCRVVKFSDIHKSIDVATAAATADCIICSYEHAPKAVRIAQELLSRERMGWCWFNEAHVLELDASFRDFASIYEVCLQCPQVCCMTATLQPRHVAGLAQKLGRKGFSESMLVCPSRPQLQVGLKVTTDAKAWISQELKRQPAGQRAIVFCLFKHNVTEMAAYLKETQGSREILECVSGAIDDMAMFRKLSSAIMVCTSVLAAGVSFDTVTMVFFLSCAHGPEYLLQGAGRGARSEQETCVATLVSTRRDMENHQRSKMSGEILSHAL